MCNGQSATYVVQFHKKIVAWTIHYKIISSHGRSVQEAWSLGPFKLWNERPKIFRPM